MFSWITDISKHLPEPESIWLVISNTQSDQINQPWAALVSAIADSTIGEFTFDFDSRVGHLGDSTLIRYHDTLHARMVTVPAVLISRSQAPGELSRVRVLIDRCSCGSNDCETSICFETGRFISTRHQLRAAA